MPTVTIPGVELVRAGSWYGTVDGRPSVTTITPAMLADAVAAASDPEVDAGPVKIGHTGAWANLGDSAPALGWVANPRVDGDRIVGDLIDVPEGLARIMPKAFRRRSAELGLGVTTPSGRRYAMTITGLALLGVAPPAVKGLADLQRLYGEEVVERRVAASSSRPESGALVMLAGAGDVPQGVQAALDAIGATLAANVAAGATTQAEADTILDAAYAAAGIPDATIPHPTANAGHTGPRDEHPRGGLTMDEARIRELMGIEAEADVEAELQRIIDAAKAATPPAGTPPATPAGSTPPAGQPAGTPAPAAPAAPAAGGAPAAPAPAGAAATPPAGELVGAGAGGTVSLSAGQYAELQAQAALGASAAATLAAQERQRIIEQATRELRITPAEAVANFAAADTAAGKAAGKAAGPWAFLMDRPPAELQAFLAGITPRAAVVELGAGNGEGAGDGDLGDAEAAFVLSTFGVEL